MPRRVSLPSADDLFRPTDDDSDKAEPTGSPARSAKRGAVRAVPDRPEPFETPRSSAPQGPKDSAPPGKRPSGRVRHDEKMTVYVTSDELLDLEHARLSLRRDQGLAVDRGRLVREAVALVLEDYEANGDESVLVRRLTGE